MKRNLFLDDCPIKLTVEDDQRPNYLILDLGEKGQHPDDTTGGMVAVKRMCEGGWCVSICDKNYNEIQRVKLPV